MAPTALASSDWIRAGIALISPLAWTFFP